MIKRMQIVSLLIAILIVSFELLAAGQQCLAQGTEEAKSSLDRESTDSGAQSASTTPTPTPTPQTRGGLSKFTGHVSTREYNAPNRLSFTLMGLGTKYLNAVIGGFVEGAGLGFGVEATTADKIHGIEFRAMALTSTRLYRRYSAGVYVPSIGDERTHAEAWFDYLQRTKDNFFGFGSRIPNIDQTNFFLEERNYQGIFYRDFTNRLQSGIYAQFSNSRASRGERERDIPIDQLFSGDPFVVPRALFAPGLNANTKIFSYGAYGKYDRRNNEHGLTKGIYLYGRVGSADGLDDDKAFSDYGWVEAELDARGYIPLGSDKTSLALRGFAELKDPKGGSQIPFYDESWLGGRSYVRGFKNFRFRGNNLVLFSSELRQTVFAQKADRGIDVVAFGDVGQVWGDHRSKTDPAIRANDDFSKRNWRAGIGGGFQYRYSRSLAARVEIGHSNERNLVYFTFSRGF